MLQKGSRIVAVWKDPGHRKGQLNWSVRVQSQRHASVDLLELSVVKAPKRASLWVGASVKVVAVGRVTGYKAAACKNLVAF